MKIRLTAVSTGEADIIAHIPARSTATASHAGYRARVARAVRHGEHGQPWIATLYAKAYRLSEGAPSVPATMAAVHSAAPHTLRGLVDVLAGRGKWWSQ